MYIVRLIDMLSKKYKYKKLPKELSVDMQALYKSKIPSFLNIDGSKTKLYTMEGTEICTRYDRIVIGDYGAYIEIDEKYINLKKLECAKGQEYRYSDKYHVKYYWLTTKDKSNCKIYHQIGEVEYADYKIGKYYISVYEIREEE